MSFLSIPADEIADVAEPSVVRTEEECKVRITDVKFADNKNNEPYALVRFAFTEHEDTKTFTKYFGIPNPAMDPDKRNNALRSLKYFYEAFDIDYSSGEVGLDELVGAEGWAMVGVDEQEDTDYGPQNYVKRFIAQG